MASQFQSFLQTFGRGVPGSIPVRGVLEQFVELNILYLFYLLSYSQAIVRSVRLLTLYWKTKTIFRLYITDHVCQGEELFKLCFPRVASDLILFVIYLSIYARICVILFFNSVLRLFQCYFSSYETGQSVGGAKTEEPREKPPGTPASRTWLVSHVARAGLEPTPGTDVCHFNEYV